MEVQSARVIDSTGVGVQGIQNVYQKLCPSAHFTQVALQSEKEIFAFYSDICRGRIT